MSDKVEELASSQRGPRARNCLLGRASAIPPILPLVSCDPTAAMAQIGESNELASAGDSLVHRKKKSGGAFETMGMSCLVF